jgi:hypothetical protein
MRSTHSRGVETTLSVRGDEGRLVIDNTDDSGQFVNGLKAVAQVIQPDLSIQPLTLRQTAPGRYEAAFPLPAMGSYLFKIRQTRPRDEGGEDEVLADFTRGLTISYKPEYRHLSLNEEFLKELSAITGATYHPSLDDVFKVSAEEAVPVRRRLWPWLLGAALILFMIDVALRRLDLAGYKVFGRPKRYG